jgi:predicted homoserine dehydrogenase-like protein
MVDPKSRGDSMDQIQVGVIGAGFMGALHARAIAESGFG